MIYIGISMCGDRFTFQESRKRHIYKMHIELTLILTQSVFYRTNKNSPDDLTKPMMMVNETVKLLIVDSWNSLYIKFYI